MTTKYYHTPPSGVGDRVRCPVCHEAIYARSDIHPQCAVRRSERPDVKGKAGMGPDLAEPADPVAVVAPPVAPQPAPTPALAAPTRGPSRPASSARRRASGDVAGP